jgi:RNA polymerase sigma-70 factor (ECF subfamily)
MDDKRGRFEAQVLPHVDAAYRFARWLSRSADDADDVVQEAVLRAFRGFDALRGSEIKAWLLTIVRHCYLSARKQQLRRAAVPLPEDHDDDQTPALHATTPGPEEASIRHDEARILSRLLHTLPEEHREVLVLREVEDLSYREIAAVTGVPIGTVMSRLARARAALRAQWRQQVEGAPHAMP